MNQPPPQPSGQKQPVNTLEQPKRPRPAVAMSAPIGRLAQNVAGSAASLTTGATGGARPKAPVPAALAPSATGKRKPRDLQGRVHDLEEMKGFSGEKEELCIQSTTRLQELEKVVAELNEERSKNARLSATLSTTVANLASAVSERDSLTLQLASAAEQVATLQESLIEATGALAGLRCESTGLMQSLEDQLATLAADKGHLEFVATDLRAKLAEKEEQLNASEQDRRALHNSLQELKGNIRVFCRLRPLLPSESAPQRPFPRLPDERTVEVLCTDPEAQRETVLTFSFDRVFPGVASQAAVYSEVQSALDGYHACIFAYVQTSAGKTHTMEGEEDDDELRGIIPRALHQVFEASLKQPHWTYTMVASFVEVYNETLRDLLVTPSQADRAPPLQLKMASKDGRVLVANLTEVPVNSASQIGELLQCARGNRAVAATKCNERSSCPTRSSA